MGGIGGSAVVALSGEAVEPEPDPVAAVLAATVDSPDLDFGSIFLNEEDVTLQLTIIVENTSGTNEIPGSTATDLVLSLIHISEPTRPY